MANKKILTDLHIDGNVGIGTDSPDSKLDVTGGNITINTTGTTFADFKYGAIGSETSRGSITTDGIDLKVNAIADLLLLPTGNVGIGTDSPDVRLEVVEASPTNGIVADFVNSTNAGGTIAAIKLSNANSDVCDVILGANRVGANFGSDFFISPSDGVDGTNRERFRITEAGNVGIGTDSPTDYGATANTLEVRGASGTGAGLIRVSNAGNTVGAAFYSGSASSTLGTQTAHPLYLSTNNSKKMTITSAGDVGIGTDSPNAKLEVRSDGWGTLAEMIRFSSTAGASTYVNSIVSKQSTGVGANTILGFDLSTGVSGVQGRVLTLLGDGNVGIGTDSPSEKLNVDGNILATGTVLGSNLSGTNTGDQDLSIYTKLDIGTAATTWDSSERSQHSFSGWDANGASWTPDNGWYWGMTLPHVSNTSTYNYSGQIAVKNASSADLYVRTISNGTEKPWNRVWTDDDFAVAPSGTNTGDQDLSTYALLTDITGTNSGTNTGDQDLSGYLPLTAGSGNTLTGDLFIEGASTPKIKITDTTNSLEGQIRVANNYMYIEADNSDAVVSTRIVFKTDGVEALYLDGNQNGTFGGTVSASNLSGTNTGDQDLSTYALAADYLLDTTDTLTGDLTVTGDIQVGAKASSDSSIISQAGDIQLRIGDNLVEHSPFVRLQGNDGTSSVYADVKLDSVNSKLVLNNPGTTGGSIGTNPTTLDSSGNLDIDGDVSATNLSGTNTGDQDLSGYALTSHNHNYILATDDRDVKPNATSVGSTVKGIQPFFTSLEGMTGSSGTNYQDLLVLDTYSDESGGNANAITLDKSDGSMRIWNAVHSATSWGTAKRVWTDDDFTVAPSGTNTGDQDLSGYLLNTADTFTGTHLGDTLHLGGSSITGSAAVLQVNGFQRTGNIYLHEGANSPTANAKVLGNNAGVLEWDGNDVWHAGNLTISGTNTGDQDLSGYLLNTTDTFTGTLSIASTAVPFKFEEFGYTGQGKYWRQVVDGGGMRFDSCTTGDGLFTPYDSFSISKDGNVSASNLSGTNTGDQDLSGYLTDASVQSKYLRSDANDRTTGNLAVGSLDATSGISATRMLKVSSFGNSEVNVDHTDGGTASDIGLFSFSRNGDHLAHMKGAHDGSITSAFLSFHTQLSGDSFSNAADNERMRITSAGKVGIGTTSPDLALDIKSGLNGGIRISATDTTQNWRDISIRSYVSETEANALPEGTHIYTSSPVGTSTETPFGLYGATVIQGRDNGNGGFAIRLGNGSGHSTRMWMGATGVTTFTNTVTASNFILSSDSRLKEKVEEVDNKSINVDWKTFEMKSDKGQKRYGVIAQELEEVHPEFVRTDEKGMKSVAYVDLLIAKNAELEARLEKLERLLLDK